MKKNYYEKDKKIIRISSILILTGLLLLSFVQPSDAFDPVDFDKQCQQKFVSQDGESIPGYEYYSEKIKERLLSVIPELLNGQIPIEDNDQNRKVIAFLKEYPDSEEWDAYPMFSQIVVSALIRHMVPPDYVETAVQHAEHCLSKVKDAMCTLICNDPHFSESFKLTITSRIQTLKIYIFGFTEPITNIQRFNVDDVHISECGISREELESWEMSHFRLDCDDFYNRHTRDLSSFSLCFPVASIEPYTSTIVMYPACLLNEDYSINESMTAQILQTLGHETTHYVTAHFIEHFTSTYGNRMFREILSGQTEYLYWICREINIPTDDTHFDVKKIRSLAYKYAADKYINENPWAQEMLSLPEEKDKNHMHDVYRVVVDHFNKINTELVYPDAEEFRSPRDLLAGTKVEFSGEAWFTESIADIIGLKAAVIAARDMSISEEAVYNGMAYLWVPHQLLYVAVGSSYPISPYRIKSAYELSLVSPDTLGFS